jgi:hypothetical protein
MTDRAKFVGSSRLDLCLQQERLTVLSGDPGTIAA